MTKIPEHVEPELSWASCAPYNFVPLPNRVVKAEACPDELPHHDFYDAKRRSGYFTVTLETKSPLYVRCGLSRKGSPTDTSKSEWELAVDQSSSSTDTDTGTSVEASMKNKPEFFYTHDKLKPVIPGSSLRGMLRSYLEIITFSKMSRVNDGRFFYRGVFDQTTLGQDYRRQFVGNARSGSSFNNPNRGGRPESRMLLEYPIQEVKAGYLHRVGGEAWIVPALDHQNESFVHVNHCDLGAFNLAAKSTANQVIFVKPEPRRKSNSSLPYPLRRSRPNLELTLAITSNVSGTKLTGYEEGRLVVSGGMNGKHMEYVVYLRGPITAKIRIPPDMWNSYQKDAAKRSGDLPTRFIKDGEPLFYLMAGTRLAGFGPTMLFRLQYRHGIHDLIPEHLRNPLDIDYADAMFGYVRAKTDFGGRKLPEQGSCELAYAGRVSVTDAKLVGEPAPEQLWFNGDAESILTPKILGTPKATTFQHYLVQGNTTNKQRFHYDSGTVLRGAKMYWHQDDVTRSMIQGAPTAQNQSQFTQLKPVRKGNSFRFKVFFENLSDAEVGALCWTLEPRGQEADSYYHKLGMGKPYGMGAVHLKSVVLTLIKREDRYNGKLFKEASDDSSGLTWNTGEPIGDCAHFSLAFERSILRDLGFQPDSHKLAEVKRIAAFLKMMAWPGFPAESARVLPGNNYQVNANVPLSTAGSPNTRYLTIELPGVPQRDKNEYAARRVLPSPLWPKFGQTSWSLTEEPPTSGNGASTVSPDSQSEQTTDSTQQTRPPAGIGTSLLVTPEQATATRHPEIEKIAQSIAGLKGPMDVSQLEGVVERLQSIEKAVPAAEFSVLVKSIGEFMQKNIRGEKIIKHSKKEWYQQMMTWGAG